MNQDLDQIEEDLKEKSESKKKQKISGRSVFKLQEIIKEKSNTKNQKELNQDQRGTVTGKN